MNRLSVASVSVDRGGASGGFGSWRHLATRFFGALSPAGPSPADETEALGMLVGGEQDLWRRMSGPDRRHAVGVARDTIALFEPEKPRREVLAAALLHDVGKVESALGTFARVGVTLAALAVGRTRLVRWSGSAQRAGHPSLRNRVGLYLTHDRLGAELLTAAGSEDLTVAWAREHHLPEDQWTVDARVGAALKAADGD
jgi:hypothetical protein